MFPFLLEYFPLSVDDDVRLIFFNKKPYSKEKHS